MLTIALVSLAVTAFAFTVLWLISLKTKDSSIVDQYWAPGFAVIAWVTYALSVAPSTYGLVLTVGVTLWAARLGFYLSRRHAAQDQEDPRYQSLRRQNSPGYGWKSLFIVFWLQAALMWIIASPIHAIFLAGDYPTSAALFVIGMMVFVAGAVIEAISDTQLARFKARPDSARRILDTGLWAWSRHPNYFGEAVLWIGLGFAAFGATGAIWALVGPVIITFLLLKVSGIPMLEHHMLRTRPDYAGYIERTSAFIPCPPQREATATARDFTG